MSNQNNQNLATEDLQQNLVNLSEPNTNQISNFLPFSNTSLAQLNPMTQMSQLIQNPILPNLLPNLGHRDLNFFLADWAS